MLKCHSIDGLTQLGDVRAVFVKEVCWLSIAVEQISPKT